MATSWSSSHPCSSTIATPSRSFPYDVFLSFRGEDTRKFFVGYLYNALVGQGIHTYRDDETLKKGETIHPSLVKAIEESQVAVIVFSKRYGDSSSCMLELAHIMECREKRGLIVMPIFYHVSPSEVRNQEGDFGKAFDTQLTSCNVDSWKSALRAAGKILGQTLAMTDTGYEVDIVNKIVTEISQKLRQTGSVFNEDLIGIDTRKQDLEKLLDVGTGGVRIVGIWGIGGGGKTTIASSVYYEICDKFDGCSFVGNIREASDKYGLEKLQEKVVVDVLKEMVASRSVEERGWMINSKLRHKKVLIVLDDVAHHDHLEALAGSHKWFGEGSRIMITTRDKHLLNAHKVDTIYDINLLNEYEAKLLFYKHVLWEYRLKEDPKNHTTLLELSEKLVSYACGIPLVLKVLGQFLCDKDTNEWKSALSRLKDIPDGDFVKKLKISYDRLKPVEQELFLDITCFFKHWGKDEAMMILDACGFHSVVGIKVLIQQAFISINHGDKFSMHDVVQEMGYYIVRREHPDNPEKHSRVWRYEDIVNMCTSGAIMEKKNNKIQVLLAPNYDAPPNLLKVVANMKKLRLLYVRQNVDKLAEEPLFLSNRLRWISWEGYPASSLPTNFQPRNLVGLILKKGLQTKLWKEKKELPSLKVLDLSDSKSLTETPNFGGLRNLERLLLSGCSKLETIHKSIGHHGKLVYMNLDGCKNLESFPPIINMQRLETLIFSGCSQLGEFPQIQQTMDSLVELCLDKSGIKVVPLSVKDYCIKLDFVSLTGCTNLVSVRFIDSDDLHDITGIRRQSERKWVICVGGDA